MYCLQHTNKHLIDNHIFASREEVFVPLVSFVDVNKDAMLDMIFYEKENLHIKYNMIASKFPAFSALDVE